VPLLCAAHSAVKGALDVIEADGGALRVYTHPRCAYKQTQTRPHMLYTYTHMMQICTHIRMFTNAIILCAPMHADKSTHK
jgi:hypothetical protein